MQLKESPILFYMSRDDGLFYFSEARRRSVERLKLHDLRAYARAASHTRRAATRGAFAPIFPAARSRGGIDGTSPLHYHRHHRRL